MIYYITMHHNVSKFVGLQASYIKRYTPRTAGEYKVYCGLSGFGEFDGAEENIKDHVFIDITNVENQHWLRMNFLFDQLKKSVTFNDEDLVVFLDGDAFPIDYWEAEVRELLQDHEAVAVERRENIEPLLADKWKPFPHPLFFVTKAKFWQDNKLKWQIEEGVGAAHAPGCKLKIWFQENNYTYAPLLRTNKVNIHPLHFGVYGNMVYHHGSSAAGQYVYDSIDIWSRPELGEKYGVAVDLHVPIIPQFNSALSDLTFQAISQVPTFIKSFFLGKE